MVLKANQDKFTYLPESESSAIVDTFRSKIAENDRKVLPNGEVVSKKKWR